VVAILEVTVEPGARSNDEKRDRVAVPIRTVPRRFWSSVTFTPAASPRFMSAIIDSARLALDCGEIVGFACMLFFPLNRTRVRARWANCLFVVAGLIGVAASVVSLMLHIGRLLPDPPTRGTVYSTLHYTYGLLLVTISALVLPGQLRGTKCAGRDRPDQKHNADTSKDRLNGL
jgi:hypothetical protein